MATEAGGTHPTGMDSWCFFFKFANLLMLQDWKSTLRELRNFGDDHGTRRRSEADYLEGTLTGNH